MAHPKFESNQLGFEIFSFSYLCGVYASYSCHCVTYLVKIVQPFHVYYYILYTSWLSVHCWKNVLCEIVCNVPENQVQLESMYIVNHCVNICKIFTPQRTWNPLRIYQRFLFYFFLTIKRQFLISAFIMKR